MGKSGRFLSKIHELQEKDEVYCLVTVHDKLKKRANGSN